MNNKLIVQGDDAKAKLLNGVTKLSNAVKIRLGPKGRNVILGAQNINPIITNDGVSIAKEIVLEDEVENAGAQILKSACV